LNELKARADRADFDLLDNDYLWRDLKAEFLQWARQETRGADRYKEDLERFEEYLPVRSIRQIDYQYVFGFREWRLSHGKTPRTVNKQVGTLGNMLNKGVEWGRIGSNPIGEIRQLDHDEPVKERRSLTVEEVEALFAVSLLHLKPVWRMFMVTGIRKAELVNMKFDDVDFDRCIVTVKAGTAKNHKTREIPLDDEMLATIAELREQAKSREPVPGRTKPGRLSRDHVFVTKANTPWRNNLLREFYRVAQKAGIEDAHSGGSVDIHSLRVTFTTLSLENGTAPKAIQTILGHSTLHLTMKVYAKATEKAKRDAINALPFASASAPGHVVSFEEAKQKSA